MVGAVLVEEAEDEEVDVGVVEEEGEEAMIGAALTVLHQQRRPTTTMTDAVDPPPNLPRNEDVTETITIGMAIITTPVTMLLPTKN